MNETMNNFNFISGDNCMTSCLSRDYNQRFCSAVCRISAKIEAETKSLPNEVDFRGKASSQKSRVEMPVH